MKHYNVVCAVIVNEAQVLCMQRPWRGSESTAGKWEFPGGKIEEWTDANGAVRRESPEDALIRELREEMDYEVSIVKPLATVEHQYPDFSLSLQAFLCTAETRDFNRKEHIDHCWLKPEELATLDWAKADEKLIEMIQNSAKGRLCHFCHKYFVQTLKEKEKIIRYMTEQINIQSLIGEATAYDKKEMLERKNPRSWLKSVPKHVLKGGNMS